jgi:peptidoglycan hydrolase-like protein with peptidoglycan-binding domain
MNRGAAARVGLAVVVVGLAGGAVAVVGGDPSAATSTASTAGDGGSATVERRDLVITEELPGEIGFGDPTAIGAAASGVVTSVPADGAIIKPGEALFAVDAEPTVLLTGTVPAYRDLESGVTGADVEQLEKALRALGYGADLTVDTRYTAATTAAVREWEGDLDRADPDGVVTLGEVRFGHGAVRVESVAADTGTQVQVGTPVIEVTGTTKVVTAQLDAARAGDLAPGTRAQLELPGGVAATGKVGRVGTEIERNADDPEAGSTVDVILTLDDPKAAAEVDTGDVTTIIERSRTENALAVPAAALLALAGGGYAVEVPKNGGGTILVPVEIGEVADGWVEVDGVDEGTDVVVAE